MDQFFVYEEYGAQYSMVLEDLKLSLSSIPNWDRHQRGLEALASCLSYTKDWKSSRRALSIDDLLAKVCRSILLEKAEL